MALRETVVKTEGHNGLQFKDHDLAHRLLDNLHGLELGPSSHNSFHLEGSLSVAPDDDFEFYKAGQVDQNGKYVEIDIRGEAGNIPVADDSQDYVLSSHVIEHIPNLLAALLELIRVTKNGGFLFSIIPQRDALNSDVGRPLTTYSELKEAYEKNFTTETIPAERTKAAGGVRGHYWVFSLPEFKQIIELFNAEYLAPLGYNLKIVESEDPDKKAGNGFTTVYQVLKAAIPEGVARTPEAVEEVVVKEFVAQLENPPEEAGLAAVMKRKRASKKAQV